MMDVQKHTKLWFRRLFALALAGLILVNTIPGAAFAQEPQPGNADPPAAQNIGAEIEDPQPGDGVDPLNTGDDPADTPDQPDAGNADGDPDLTGSDTDGDTDPTGGDADGDTDPTGGDTDGDTDLTGGDTDGDTDLTGGDTNGDTDLTGGNADDDTDLSGGNADDDTDLSGGNADDDTDLTGGNTDDDTDQPPTTDTPVNAAPEEDPTAALQAEVTARLEALKPYLAKEAFTAQERQDLNDGLEQVAKFCGENGIPGLTAEQQALWDLLAQAILTTPEVAYEAQIARQDPDNPGETIPRLYATVQEAINDANDEETITLLKDVVGESIYIPDKDITLDMNHHSYRVDDYGYLYSDGNVYPVFYIAPRIIPTSAEGQADEVPFPGVVIKNGTIASSVADILILNTYNLLLEDMTLDATGVPGQSALGCEGGLTAITGKTTLAAEGADSAALSLSHPGNDEDPISVLVDPDASEVAITGNLSVDCYDLLAGGKLTLALGSAQVTGQLQLPQHCKTASVTKAADNLLPGLALPTDCHWDSAGTALEWNTLVAENTTTGKQYASLEEAVAEVQSGNTIKLLTSTAGASLALRTPFTLDLCGHTYRVTDYHNSLPHAALVVYPNCQLTLTSTAEQPGVLEFDPLLQRGTSSRYLLDTRGTVSCTNVTLKGDSQTDALSCSHTKTTLGPGTQLTGVIRVGSGCTLNLSQATLTDCTLDLSDFGQSDVVIGKEQQVALPFGYEWRARENDANFLELHWNDQTPPNFSISRDEDGDGQFETTIPFYTMAEALANANPGETIRLMNHVDESPFDIYKSVTLDLNGYTYRVEEPSETYALEVSANGEVTITSSRRDADGNIVNGSIASSVLPNLVVNTSTLTLENVTLDVQAPEQCALSNTEHVILTGSTRLSASQEGTALYTGTNYIASSVQVAEDSSVTISGPISVQAKDPEKGPFTSLDLGSAAVTHFALEADPRLQSNVDVRKSNQELAAPEGYRWETMEDPSRQKLVWDNRVAEINGTYYSSLNSAVQRAEENATITLLQDTFGTLTQFTKSITLDLNGHNYVAYSSNNSGTSLYIFPDQTVTIRNGSIIPGDLGIGTLIENRGNLVLEKVTAGTQQFEGSVLYCPQGSVQLQGETALLASEGNGYALDLGYGYGGYIAPISVDVSDECTLTGIMDLYADPDRQPGPNDMVLNLNGAAVTGPLYVEESAQAATVTKNPEKITNAQLPSPPGMFWMEDRILMKSVSPEAAIAYGESDDSLDGRIYFDDLGMALAACDEVTLLKNVNLMVPGGDSYIDEDLVISRSVTLDLNGHAIGGGGLIFTDGTSTVQNGRFYGETYSYTYLTLAGGSVTLKNMDMGSFYMPTDLGDSVEPGMAYCGVLVEGSASSPSSLVVEDTIIRAGYCGIAVTPRDAASGVNAVTVSTGSRILAQVGISDNHDPIDTDDTAQTAPNMAVSIAMNGEISFGSFDPCYCGIEHMANGPLTIGDGAVITAWEYGVIHNSADPLTISNATIRAGAFYDYDDSDDGQLIPVGNPEGGFGILHLGSGSLALSGATIEAGICPVLRDGSGSITLSGGKLIAQGNPGQGATAASLEDHSPNDFLGYGIAHLGEGTITVTGGEIQASGVAIFREGNGDISVEGGVLTAYGCHYSDWNQQDPYLSEEFPGFGIVHLGEGAITATGGKIQAPGAVIYRPGNGDITIAGASLQTLGSYPGSNLSPFDLLGCGICHEGSGTVTVKDGSAIDAGFVGISRSRGGSTILSGGTIRTLWKEENNQPVGCGIFCYGEPGTVQVTGGKIQDYNTGISIETESVPGGSASTLTISGGSITDCLCGVYLGFDNAMTVSGGSIEAQFGILADGSTIEATGGSIIATGAPNNQDAPITDFLGYGITLLNNSTATISGSTVHAANVAIHLEDDSDITVKSGTLKAYGLPYQDWNLETPANSADTLLGYGISHMGTGDIIIEGGTIQGAAAAICREQDGDILISGGTMKAWNRYSTQKPTPDGTMPLSHGIYHAGSGEIIVSGEATSIEAGLLAIYREQSGPVTLSGGTIRTFWKDETGMPLGCGICYAPEATGEITMTGGKILDSSDGIVLTNQKFTFSGGTIADCSTGILANGSSTVSLSGGTISACRRGIELLDEAALLVSSGAIADCDTGILAEDSSTVDMSGGSMTNCAQGILHRSGKMLTVSGGSIQATDVAICKEGDGDITVKGGTLTAAPASDSPATARGYGIAHMGAGTITVEGGTVQGETVAIYRSGNGSITVKDASLKAPGNNADQGSDSWPDPGKPLAHGIYHLGSGEVTVSGESSIAAGYVAIYRKQAGVTTLSGGTLSTTWKASGLPMGCGIFCQNGQGTVSVTGGQILDCDTGISVGSSSTVSLTGGSIENCSSGVYLGKDSTLMVSKDAAIRNCLYEGIYLTGAFVTVSGGTIQNCGTGIYGGAESTAVITDGSIAADLGIWMEGGSLEATGGTITGIHSAVSAKATDSERPMTLLIDGAVLEGKHTAESALPVTPTLALLDAKQLGMHVTILSGTLNGPIHAEGDIDSSLAIYKDKALSLTVSSPTSTVWEKDGNLMRLKRYQEPVPPGIKVTIQWVGDTAGDRPEYQDISVLMNTPMAKLRALLRAADPTATDFRVYPDGDNDNRWIAYLGDDADLAKWIENVLASQPEGYTSNVVFGSDGIVITNTWNAQDAKPDDEDNRVIIGYNSYVISRLEPRVRTKYSYRGSGSSSGGGGGGGGLLQTGQLNWPIPVLGTSGLLILAAGLCLMLRKKRAEGQR